MKYQIKKFEEIEIGQTFYNPRKPDFDNPFSKHCRDTFVEKHSACFCWSAKEKGWPLEGVLIEISDGQEVIDMALRAQKDAKLKVAAMYLVKKVEGFEEFVGSDGDRLTDTKEWVEFYVAFKALNLT